MDRKKALDNILENKDGEKMTERIENEYFEN